MSSSLRHGGMLALVAVLLWLSAPAQAERISDIRNTKHNFSATVIPILPDGAQRNAAASSESQICAFCHTPHGATKAPKAPLWNRKLSGVTYTPYSSGSLDAIDLDQPRAKSKLCLSCHDGTLALGAVNVLNRVENPNIDFTGPGIGAGDTIPEGLGPTTGFTRRLGVNLTNDHPISFTYDSAQALRDGELYDPNLVAHLGDRQPGERAPTVPLEENRVECISCHDPHIRDTSGENIKFLRVNRFQTAEPVQGAFDANNDIICLACHDKAGWVGSAHASSQVATYTYQDPAADLREFPRGMQVWQAACLNCHDPHTVEGSRRILREGTDGPTGVTNTGARFRYGGQAAIEQVCYACHSADGGVLRGGHTGGDQSTRPGFGVPDIKTDFTTLPRHMPMASDDQLAGREVHDIGTGLREAQGGKDFVEAPHNMGKGDLTNRHAECTDCHNPHRVTRNRLFNDDPNVPDPEEGTHNHTLAQLAATGGIHTNLASGVLRGISGVEPGGWPSTAFGSQPTHFEVKRGDPGVGGSTDVNAPYVTREYQVCMKCHSNYSYDTPPPLGLSRGTTPPGTNAMFEYTNQGMEYQSPDDHKGEGTPMTPTGAFVAGPVGECTAEIGFNPNNPPSNAADISHTVPAYRDSQGNCINYNTDNHRSWHPALKDTGRTIAVRAVNNPDIWRTPFNAGVGVQTMYCTDCHGSNTNVADGVVPPGGPQGNVWGPHGSNHNFLLKGPWDDQTGTNQPDGLCFRCHDYNYYGRSFPTGPVPDSATLQSGFRRAAGGGACVGAPQTNLHTGHAQQGVVRNFRCSYCHIAVPHGWKNKNFLVNLNDVGPEAGLPAGTQVRTPSPQRYYRGPYYNGSTLKVAVFRRSGQWTAASCGSAGPPGNGDRGVEWMNGSGDETCNNIP